jgi:hypothetical protein
VGVFGGGVAGVWDDVDAVAEVCAGSCGAFDRLRRSPRGSSSGNATALAVARLQRDPDSEEPEAPLVETGIPDRVHRVSPVIEWRWRRPIPWREWPIPCWRRRSTPAPRRGSVAPRSTTPLPVEVSTLPGRRPTVVARAALVARTPGLQGIHPVLPDGPAAPGPTRSAPMRHLRSARARRTRLRPIEFQLSLPARGGRHRS